MGKKGFLTGLLLFGLFFGAGNLIFPPALGAMSGTSFWTAILGFVISSVALPMLALIIGTFNPKGYFDDSSKRLGKVFAVVYLVVVYLTIGPLFAIPRTATVSFSVGIEPMLAKDQAQFWLGVFTLVYFALAGWLSFNTSKLLDRVGKVLTPIFAGLIVVLIVLGAFRFGATSSSAPTTGFEPTAAFGTGLLQGYNTLDGIASVAFSVVGVQTLKQLGFASRKEYTKTIWFVGAFMTVFFSTLYIGLGFLGNKFPVPADLKGNKGTYILSHATQVLFGSQAQLFLAALVILTCFTTTIGLIVATAEFFAKLYTPFTYKQYVSVFTVVGFAIANLGLDTIIQFSVPVLLLLYPVTVTLVLLISVNKFLPLSKLGMQLTMGVVTLLAVFDVLSSTFKLTTFSPILSLLPLRDQSLGWLIPAIIGIAVSLVLPGKYKDEWSELEFSTK